MLEVPFANQEGQSSVEQNSRETLINMFAEIEVAGRKQLIRRQRAGIKPFIANTGVKRCLERNKGKHYVIIGNTLYRIDGAALTALGTLATSEGRCTMIFNANDEIMISDGSRGYVYDGATLQEVISPVGIGHLAYQGGFGIFISAGTDQFYVTGVNNFKSIDPLDFATAESYSDKLVRIFIDHSEVWLFGETSVEIWQLSGNVDFPFSRFTNSQLERGCAAAFSVAADDNTVFWLGDDGIFYRADGYRPVVISTGPVDREIEKLPQSVKATAEAFVYTRAGNKFYTVSFPGYLTLQYNIKTGFWNKAETFGKSDWQIFGSAGHTSEYFLTPNGIVTLEDGLSTDEGGIIRRSGISAPLHADGERVTVRSFWLDAEMGRSDIGKPSNIMMRVAKDGETFQNERWRDLGPIGEYTRRAVWRNLGQGRRFTFEFAVTDPVEFSIVSAGVT